MDSDKGQEPEKPTITPDSYSELLNRVLACELFIGSLIPHLTLPVVESMASRFEDLQDQLARELAPQYQRTRHWLEIQGTLEARAKFLRLQEADKAKSPKS